MNDVLNRTNVPSRANRDPQEIDMTTDEINRYIHTKILAKPCWHDIRTWRYGAYGGIKFYEAECVDCGDNFGREEYQIQPTSADFNPDYCSDSSPRSLLNEVVRKTVDGPTYDHEQVKKV